MGESGSARSCDQRAWGRKVMVLVVQVLAYDSMRTADEQRFPAVVPLRCPPSHPRLGGS